MSMTAWEILAIMEEIVQMASPRTLVLAQMVLEEATVKQVYLMIHFIFIVIRRQGLSLSFVIFRHQ